MIMVVDTIYYTMPTCLETYTTMAALCSCIPVVHLIGKGSGT